MYPWRGVVVMGDKLRPVADGVVKMHVESGIAVLEV
jgi:hypothetical protein